MIKHHKIALFGGSGFVGRALLKKLSKDGHSVSVYSRHPERQRHLNLFQGVKVRQFLGSDNKHWEDMLEGHDVAINLIAILNESKDTSYRKVHVEFAQRLIRAAENKGVKRYLHMSALNAHPAVGTSEYLRTKGEAESAAHASKLAVTSFRPSVIFGEEDAFVNNFAKLLKQLPMMLVPAPYARLAPIHVEDVAQAMVNALDNPDTYGERYDLCGEADISLLDVLHHIKVTLELKKPLIKLSPGLSRLMARLMELAPGEQPLSRETLRMLELGSVCQNPMDPVLGVKPRDFLPAMVEILKPNHTRHRYDDYRKWAAR